MSTKFFDTDGLTLTRFASAFGNGAECELAGGDAFGRIALTPSDAARVGAALIAFALHAEPHADVAAALINGAIEAYSGLDVTAVPLALSLADEAIEPPVSGPGSLDDMKKACLTLGALIQSRYTTASGYSHAMMLIARDLADADAPPKPDAAPVYTPSMFLTFDVASCIWCGTLFRLAVNDGDDGLEASDLQSHRCHVCDHKGAVAALGTIAVTRPEK